MNTRHGASKLQEFTVLPTSGPYTPKIRYACIQSLVRVTKESINDGVFRYPLSTATGFMSRLDVAGLTHVSERRTIALKAINPTSLGRS